MKENNDGFVRADQIDLKSLDEQLERHLSRAWTMEKQRDGTTTGGGKNKVGREEWEIDPTKLIIKTVIARGTFGTVHRGIYDGLDVAVKLLDWGEEGHRTEAEISSLRTAFTQEVVVWHKLDHPNVTRFIGATMGNSGLSIQSDSGFIGMPSNICCVVVEYLPGGALKSYLIKNRRKKLPFNFIGATMGNSWLSIQSDSGFIGIPSNICCVVVEYLPGGALKSYLIKNRRKKLPFKVVVQLALDLARGLSYLHSKKIVHRDVKTENMLLDKQRTVKIAGFGVARVETQTPHDDW